MNIKGLVSLCIMAFGLFFQSDPILAATPDSTGTSTNATADSPAALVISMQSDFSPYSFINSSGQPAGLFVDIWELWSEKTGTPVDFQLTTWNETLEQLKSGDADIHSGLFYTDDRAEWIGYSEPFYECSSCFFCPSSEHDDSYEPGTLAGDKVAVVKGAYQEEYIRTRFPEAERIPVAGIEQMVREVLSENAHRCYGEILSTRAIIDRLGLQGQIHFQGKSLQKKQFHAGVTKENTDLLEQIDSGFQAISADELIQIEKRWVRNPEHQYYYRSLQKVMLTVEERSWLEAHPDITLIFPEGHEPSMMKDSSGRIVGAFADRWDLLNTRLGIDVKYELVPMSEIPRMLEEKEAEGMAFASPRLIEKLDLLGAGPAVRSYVAIYGPTTHSTFRFPQDLHGKKVAVLEGYDHTDVAVLPLKRKANLVEVSSPLEGLMAVHKGRADFFIGSIGNNYFINKYLLVGIGPLHVFWADPYTAVPAIRSDLPELATILNKAAVVIGDIEFTSIVGKWLPDVVSQDRINLSIEEQTWLAQNRTVRVSFWNHPPYFYLHNGQVVGLSVDLLNRVSENTGISFQFENRLDRFSDVLKGLKEQEGPDLVGALMPTADREQKILFTESYKDSPRFIFTRDDAPFISSIENLFDQPIAVVEDYAVHEQLVEMYPHLSLVVFPNNEAALKAVSSGKAFAFIGDLVSTPAMINEFGLKNLKAACPSGLPDHPLAMAIRNDWPELRSIVDKGLAAIPAEEKAAIINTWSSVKIEHGITPADVLKRTLLITGFAVLIVLLFISWNKQLRSKVEISTAEGIEIEGRLRSTFEQAAVGIAHASLTGNFIRINQKFCDIVGYTQEEMLRLRFQEITHPDDQKADSDHLIRVLGEDAEDDFYSLEKRYIHKDGHPVWVNLTVTLVRDESGNPAWFVGVIQDITERKLTEEALQESERLLKVAQKTAHIGIHSGDMVTKEGTWSDELYRIFGYAPGEIEPSFETAFNHVHPEDRKKWLKANQDHIQQKTPYQLEYRIIRKDGAVRTILVWSSMEMDDAGVPIRTVGLTQDITERKQMEESLTDSEERFRKVFEGSPSAITLTSLDTGFFIDTNPAFERDFGYAREKVVGKSSLELEIWKDPSERARLMPEYLEKGYLHVPELELIRKNGDIAIVDVHFTLTQVGDEKVSIAAFADITERKQAEGALKESQEMFSKAFYEQPLAMQIVNLKTGERMDTNGAMCELTGYSKEEFEAEETYTHGLWVDPEAQKQGAEHLLKERVTRNFPADIRSKDGTIKHLILNASMLDVGDGNVGIVSAIDVTESQKAQEALDAYQVRLRALASEITLTEEQERRRIATELHDGAAQSLAYARLQLTSALKSVDDTRAANKLDDLSQLLKESLQQIRGVLLDLSSPALNEIGLAAALQEWLEEQVERRHGIRTAFTHACPDDLEIHEDILAMLFRNARELLANIIKYAEAQQVAVDMRCDDTTLYISIRDDGVGFDPDKLAKRPGSTGGFGLFSVRERMSDMGGTLDIHSEPGKGCTSLLSLPLQCSLKGKRP